jgi:putative endonuclease
MKSTSDIGGWGEDLAVSKLRALGYRILGTRVHVDARSEIDIVARDGEVLVFAEVKTRASEEFGTPAEAVDRRKRHRLSRAAVRYLRSRRLNSPFIRFDIVEVIGSDGVDEPEIRHIPDAFSLDRRYLAP